MIGQNQFVQFLASLAPEGETLLIVQQKPVTKQGKPVLHLDGSPKYVWMPQMPDAPRKDGLAWYANTGSFIMDRMQGKLSATKYNCEYVLCMMLDDIGTKSKVPPLEPTWIIETSNGSYQYGYAFSEQPTKDEYVAAITAIAAGGFTDPGATNAVRNFRVPGSVNLKPERGGFTSRLIAFNPERNFTLESILDALEITPAQISTNNQGFHPVHLTDTGGDPILAWLDEKGLVLSKPNGEGWVDVVCPNCQQHSDGTINARYRPVDHGFFCFHGHCAELTTKVFLDWVRQSGGPDASHGVRPDVLEANLSDALGSAEQPQGVFRTEAKDVLSEAKEKQAERDEVKDWFRAYAYNPVDDAFFAIATRTHVPRRSFDALYRKHHLYSRKTKKPVSASHYFDENRDAEGARVVHQYVYAPGYDALFEREGHWYGNLWANARPDAPVEYSAPDVWLEHAERIVPNRQDREHLFDMMAFKVQNPKVKINHGVLHVGVQGCGKDTFWKPFIRAICGDAMKNFALVDNDQIDSNYSYHVESEVIVLNELKEPSAADRRALANKLKPIIAAPPDMLDVRKRYLHPYQAMNTAFILAYSNELLPLSLDSGDRRWFCIESPTGKLPSEESDRIWKWYTAGGFDSVAAWLWDRDVSAFNPAQDPPMTDYKQAIIEGGMSAAESFVLECLEMRRDWFKTGVIASPFASLCEKLTIHAPAGVRIVPAALFHALQEAGWRNKGQVHSPDNPTKKTVWCAPELDSKTKAELRDLIEVPTTTATIHKLGA